MFAFVQERDVDFLVVEELACSFQFRRLLLTEVLPGVNWESMAVEVVHSVSRTGGAGETDIEVRLTPRGKRLAPRVLVLIEDKVDATFQPRQPERYQEAALEAVRSGAFGLAKTLLLAPEAYLHSRSEVRLFDANLSYEEMISHFRGRANGADPEARARYAHRAAVLDMAVTKARRGYTPVVNDSVSTFWLRYWDLASSDAPSLDMQPPSGKPAKSTWVRFPRALDGHPGLPLAFLSHKLEQGRVHLELPGWAAEIGPLRDVLSSADVDIVVRRAGKSAALSISVPAVDAAQPFETQVESVRNGLIAAVRLQKWWAANWSKLLAMPSRDESA